VRKEMEAIFRREFAEKQKQTMMPVIFVRTEFKSTHSSGPTKEKKPEGIFRSDEPEQTN
jgi:hypothetical protein